MKNKSVYMHQSKVTDTLPIIYIVVKNRFGGLNDTHFGQFRVPIRVNQVPPVVQGLHQGQKAGVGLTGSSEYSRSNGVHKITKKIKQIESKK